MHTYMCISGGKKCSFFGKLGVLCFIETPNLRFVLLPYYRKTVNLRLIYENVCRLQSDKQTNTIHSKPVAVELSKYKRKINTSGKV